MHSLVRLIILAEPFSEVLEMCSCIRNAELRNEVKMARYPSKSLRQEKGQASVEAALCIPLLFIGILLLVQPGIVLYDRMIMKSAAAEACRALATSDNHQQIEELVRRRLGAVPQHDCFHIHDGGCSWKIELIGGPSSRTVTVHVRNQVKPLPLISFGERALGLTNNDGNLEIEVSVQQDIQPEWTANSTAGSDPSGWVGAWLQ